MNGETEFIVVLSDLHVGSTVAPWPAGFRLDDGGAYEPSILQAWLNDCYNHFVFEFVQSVTGGDYTVVLNGDIVEGDHHRTAQIVTKHLGTQTEAAMQLLAPLTKNAKALYMVRGTPVHVGSSGEYEERIGIALGARHDGNTLAHTHWKLRMDVNGAIIEFDHHVGTGSPHTEFTGLQSAMTKRMLECARHNIRCPNLMVRSHRHTFDYVKSYGVDPDGQQRGRAAVTLPAWQLATEFVSRVKPESIPQIGGIVVEVKPDGRHLIHEQIYPYPHPGVSDE